MKLPYGRRGGLALAALVALSAIGLAAATGAGAGGTAGADPPTTTPIKHLVVIFQENVSFDHYFGTYPNAANPAGEPPFTRDAADADGERAERRRCSHPTTRTRRSRSGSTARRPRPATRTTTTPTSRRLRRRADGPVRRDRSAAAPARCADYGTRQGHSVMGYYDGNTVTALWNYAQHFAMSDNSYGTTSGRRRRARSTWSPARRTASPDATEHRAVDRRTPATVIGDPQPTGDNATPATTRASTDANDKNVGDLLNAKGITWGWFQGGFRDRRRHDGSRDTCNVAHGTSRRERDYIPHHEPFQYYASTANPQHLPPTLGRRSIGHTDQANHQYDLTDFWTPRSTRGNLPAVSFLKAPAYQDGHAGYSDPLDEQRSSSTRSTSCRAAGVLEATPPS